MFITIVNALVIVISEHKIIGPRECLGPNKGLSQPKLLPSKFYKNEESET